MALEFCCPTLTTTMPTNYKSGKIETERAKVEKGKNYVDYDAILGGK